MNADDPARTELAELLLDDVQMPPDAARDAMFERTFAAEPGAGVELLPSAAVFDPASDHAADPGPGTSDEEPEDADSEIGDAEGGDAEGGDADTGDADTGDADTGDADSGDADDWSDQTYPDPDPHDDGLLADAGDPADPADPAATGDPGDGAATDHPGPGL